MFKSFYILFIIITIDSLLISCKSKQEGRSNIVNITTNLDNQKTFLTKKYLKSLNKIMNDSIDIRNRLLFLYNGGDCETCLKNGFKLVNMMDSLVNNQVVYVITSSTNIGADQLRYNYIKYIYYDEHDLIRSELKYIYTPVFLVLDSMNRIDDVFYPSYISNITEENLFIKNCLKKWGLHN